MQRVSAKIEIYSQNYKSARAYSIYSSLTKDQIISVAQNLLTNNNWRVYFDYHEGQEWIEHDGILEGNKWLTGKITEYISKKDTITEISYHPGVTDNMANTLKKMIAQKFHYVFTEGDVICSSQLFVGDCKSRYNPLIESKVTGKAYNFSPNLCSIISHQVIVGLEAKAQEVTDLEKYNEKNSLGLSVSSLTAIKKHFKSLDKNPKDIELEALAQTWSEHCKHTIFSSPLDDIRDGLYKTYIKAATENITLKKKDFCVSVFSDNAGGISFTKDWVIAVKVETHNSPSALEPFGGAMTGILGVNRDIIGFGKGAKPIANTYGFCFADHRYEYNYFRDKELEIPILTPQEIAEGVIAGVEVGGNSSGIPTPQGFVFYDKQFIAKPLVFVGTIGLIPRVIKKQPSHIKNPEEGDYIVIIGGDTGKDGIHGATFSSEALNTASPTSAVQIGDPITQKKLSDAMIKEARDLNLYNSITDNGAGGLSSSVGEMGIEGFAVSLEKVPLKYQGMAPWEIWVSEAQERMTLAVPPKKYDQLQKIMKKHDVNIAKIGTFTKNKKAFITYNSEVVLDLNTDFLHEGKPVEHLRSESITVTDKPETANKINLESRKYISELYDHEVQGSSILKPLQGEERVSADATVIRPILSLEKGLAVSQGLGILLDDAQNPYYMAASAIDTAIRNLVIVGANPGKIALLDNFCWSNSTSPKRLWQLKQAAKACYDYATIFETPFISGKDSMFNDFKGYDSKGNFVHLTSPPTLLVTAIGIVDDIEKCLSLDAKFRGDLVYLLGENRIFFVDGNKAMLLYKKFHEAIKQNLIASAISVNLGGIRHALVRTRGKFNIELNKDQLEFEEEYPSRIVVTINPSNREKFKDLFPENILIGKIA